MTKYSKPELEEEEEVDGGRGGGGATETAEVLANGKSSSKHKIPLEQELSNTACKQGMLKRKVQFDVSTPRKKFVDELRLDGSNLCLKGEAEKVVVALEQDLKNSYSIIALLRVQKEAWRKAAQDRGIKIATLQGDKEALDKVVADKDKEISKLEEDLKKAIAAIERDAKVKDKEISSLKSENAWIKNVVDEQIGLCEAEITRIKNVIKGEIPFLKAERIRSANNDEMALLKSEISKLKSVSDNEISSLKAENSKLVNEVAFLKAENSKLKTVRNDEKFMLKSVVEDCRPSLKVYTRKKLDSQASRDLKEMALLKAEISKLKSVSDNEISSLQAENSKLDNEIAFLKAENMKLKSVRNDEKSVEDCRPLLKVYTRKKVETQASRDSLHA